MLVRSSTRGWDRVAGGIGLAIVLLTLSCASRLLDHPALADEGSPSAELTLIRVPEMWGRWVPSCRRIDGETIACLRIGRYTTVRLRPGHYRLSPGSSSTPPPPSAGPRRAFEIDMGAAEIDIEAGEAAYVVIRAGRSEIVTPEEAKDLMREYKRVGED